MYAITVAGGEGQRLRPYTEDRPKPMVPVGDAPAVAHVARSVRLAEMSRIVVNVHHRPADVEAWQVERAAALGV